LWFVRSDAEIVPKFSLKRKMGFLGGLWKPLSPACTGRRRAWAFIPRDRRIRLWDCLCGLLPYHLRNRSNEYCAKDMARELRLCSRAALEQVAHFAKDMKG
jgi:hypothetical protein